MRTFLVTKLILNEYITEGEEYTLQSLNGIAVFCRNQKEVCCSFMRVEKFKECLRNGSIIFTDNPDLHNV